MAGRFQSAAAIQAEPPFLFHNKEKDTMGLSSQGASGHTMCNNRENERVWFAVHRKRYAKSLE